MKISLLLPNTWMVADTLKFYLMLGLKNCWLALSILASFRNFACEFVVLLYYVSLEGFCSIIFIFLIMWFKPLALIIYILFPDYAFNPIEQHTDISLLQQQRLRKLKKMLCSERFWMSHWRFIFGTAWLLRSFQSEIALWPGLWTTTA